MVSWVWGSASATEVLLLLGELVSDSVLVNPCCVKIFLNHRATEPWFYFTNLLYFRPTY